MPLLRLLGTPHLDTDSGRLDLLPQRPALLLWRLALEGDWLTREYLADLFWPEGRDGDARHNLRLLIARARKVPWAAGLECEPTRLRWVTDSDTERFRRAVSAGAWADALRWYRQPLLSGLPTLNLPQYESWLEGERYGLHAAWREAVRQRAEQAPWSISSLAETTEPRPPPRATLPARPPGCCLTCGTLTRWPRTCSWPTCGPRWKPGTGSWACKPMNALPSS